MNRSIFIIGLVILVSLPSLSLAGIPKMINYQGMLTDNSGNPLTDTVNITFKIYDDPTGGNKKWEEIQNDVSVINGLFNVILGSVNPIDTLSFSQDYWLDITVGAEHMLSRLKFTSVGYAYRAQNADTADYARGGGGGAGSPWIFRTSDGSDTTITTGGRWGVARYGNTLYGTADSTYVNLGVACTTGTSGENYKYCTVAGGIGNIATGLWGAATVGGGRNNKAIYTYATIGGGWANQASDFAATIAGGDSNTSASDFSTVGGGYKNNAQLTGPYATISGGRENTTSDYYATISGGTYNQASEIYTSIGGGFDNTASNQYATIGGGYKNTASGTRTTIAGGDSNVANSQYATIGGGYHNLASDYRTTIAGGYQNSATDFDATIGGGYGNTASGGRATIAGGWANAASATSATVGGGEHDTASSNYATVGGGYHNNVSGTGATIPGGYENKVRGDYSFAVGRQVTLTSDADYTFAFGNNFTTSASHAVIFYDAANPTNVGIGVTDPQAELEVYQAVRVRNMWNGTGTTVVITAEGDLRKQSSSKRYKEDIRHLEILPEEILKLQPVRFRWKATGEEDIGLVAEEVNEIIPDLVIYDKEGKPDAVKHDKVALYLLEMVKAQQEKIDAQQEQIDILKSEIEKMKSGGQ